MLAPYLHRPEIWLAAALAVACGVGYLLRHVDRTPAPSERDPLPRATIKRD